jgi:glycine cleavage system regulatory protein
MTSHIVLTTIGDDRPGLVDEVSRYVFERGGNVEDSRMVNLHGQFVIMMLAGHGVNIESMQTRLAEAPITGTPVFAMELVVSVPRAQPIGELRAELARLCDDLNLDWQLAAL